MTLQTLGEGRKAFVFNGQRVNLHIRGHECEPKALPPRRARGAILSVYMRAPGQNLIKISEYA